MVPMRQRLTGLPGGSSKWGVRASWLAVCCAALSLSAQSGAALFGFQWPGLWVASLPSSAIILILLACSIAYRDAVGATDGIARLPVIVAVALLLVRVALELPLTATAHGIGAVLLPEPFATAVAMLAELGRKPTLCLLAIALAELLLRVGRPILSQFAAFAALAICANAAIYLADNMPLQYAFMGPSTTIAAAGLAAAVLLGSTGHGLMRALTADTQASRSARFLLSGSTAAIFLTCWLFSHKIENVADRAVLADEAGAVLALTWLLSSIGTILADRIDRQRLAAESSLERAATTDGLTGLLNRHRLHDLTEVCAREFGMAAFVNIDLDRFRTVGGPAGGDAILVEIARRLTGLARDHQVGRLGSDQFGILCPGASLVEALHCGELALSAIRHPVESHGRTYYLRASIGIAHSDDAVGTSLPQAADDAMYVAKGRGGNQIAVFERSMHDSRQQELELKHALYGAIDAEDQLSLEYQPVVRVSDGALLAVEALARWYHPRLGSIPPDRFIPLAESTGLIDELGARLMDEVVRQAAVWYGRFGEAGPVVNLNISPVQFATTDVIADLDRLVRQHRLPASRICIELTESAVTDDVAVAALREARQLGFGVAMDDFGIGYSSLSRLPRLPLVAVKLDRSFVVHAAENDGDATLLRGIVTLAHRLKLKVIAEGVSTRAQYDLLTECQCDAAQGFLFARPMPASEVEALFQVRDGEDDGRQAVLF